MDSDPTRSFCDLRRMVVKQFNVDAAFKQCAKRCISKGSPEFPEKGVLSVLMAYGARPSPEDLIGLSRTVPSKEFKDCCLEAVISADNPFVPGMTLSVELCTAAVRARNGEKRPLIDTQAGVDAVLLNIFDHLPPTVRGFDEHMAGCSEVFEPEWRGPADVSKPLVLALERQKQRETFCSVPLVMDFLSRRFTFGLPNLRDTEGVLDDREELQHLGGGLANVTPGHGLVLGDQTERIDLSFDSVIRHRNASRGAGDEDR